jgi:hypothetical protein
VNGFIVRLYTRLGTTSNYIAIADLHTLQIMTAHAKPQSLIVFPSRCLVTALNNGDPSRRCPLANTTHNGTHCSNWPGYNISAQAT